MDRAGARAKRFEMMELKPELKFGFHFHNPSLLAKRVVQRNNGLRFSKDQIILEPELEPKTLDAPSCSQSLKFESRLHSPKAVLA